MKTFYNSVLLNYHLIANLNIVINTSLCIQLYYSVINHYLNICTAGLDINHYSITSTSSRLPADLHPAPPTPPPPPAGPPLHPETQTGGAGEEARPPSPTAAVGGSGRTAWTPLCPAGWRRCRCTDDPAPRLSAG